MTSTFSHMVVQTILSNNRLSKKHRTIHPLILAFGMIYSVQAVAQSQTPEQLSNNQVQLQQQRESARNQALVPTPSVTIDTNSLIANKTTAPIDSNAPCFTTHQIGYTTLTPDTLKDVATFGFALVPATHGKTSLIGQCLGVAQINQLATDVQNRIIDKGYATTRVVVGNQNLKSGILLLTLIPGYLDNIKADTRQSKAPMYVDNSGLPANFAPALRLKAGELLNIRELETGLENLKRVPTADAEFSISPSSRTQSPGHSDVLIKYSQSRQLRLGIGIDDSGSKATGKYQGNVILSFDNPSYHNDLLYLTYGRDLGNRLNDQIKGSKNYALGYVLPLDNWLFNTNASHYTYNQTVAGANQDYTYSGDSNSAAVNASYLAHRNAKSKTYLNAGGFYKAQNNYIDDTEVDVQRRKIAGWTVGITHDTSFRQNQLKTDISYQRGTGVFGALTPPESLFNEGTARTGIYKISSTLNSPLTLGLGNKSQQFAYTGTLKGQYAIDALVPSERMAIGGRYTVRGFDGERSLSGDHGVLIRQDISMPMGKRPHAIYTGLDAGYVTMKNSAQNVLLLGHQLIGASMGVKGQIKQLHATYDIFTGYPIDQPAGFGKKDWASGFSLNFEF